MRQTQNIGLSISVYYTLHELNNFVKIDFDNVLRNEL